MLQYWNRADFLEGAEVRNISPVTVLEFSDRTIRVSRSAVIRPIRSFFKPRRVVTHCFSFPSGDSQQDLHKIIRRQLKIHGLKVKNENVILSLPRHKAMSRLIRLPSQDTEETNNMVALQVFREGLYNKENKLIHDYKIVGSDGDGSSLISVFYMREEYLRRYFDILEKIGIYPMGVTLNSQGLLDWLLLQRNYNACGSEKCTHLLNIDDGTYDYIVVFKGSLLFSRSFVLPEGEFIDYTKWLAKEVKVSFEMFRRTSRGSYESEEELYIVGASDEFPEKDFGKFVSCRIKSFNPPKRLEAKSYLKYPAENSGVSYASVLGLALKREGLKGIDITPAQMRVKALQRKNWLFLREVFVLAAAILLCFSFFLFRLIDLKSRELADARQKLSALASMEKAAASFAKLDFLNTEISNGYDVLNILGELYDLVPESVFITDLEIKDGKPLAIRGFGAEPASVFKFLESLGQSGLFGSVYLDYVDSKTKKGDSTGVSFQITASVQGHDDTGKSRK